LKFLRALETQAHSLIKTQDEARIEGELDIHARLVPTMATWNMLSTTTRFTRTITRKPPQPTLSKL